MKRAVDRLQANEEIYPPLSWAQVTQLLLDFYLVSLPIALVDRMFVSDAGPIQPWPMIGAFLITLFFQGLMRCVLFPNFRRTPSQDSHFYFTLGLYCRTHTWTSAASLFLVWSILFATLLAMTLTILTLMPFSCKQNENCTLVWQTWTRAFASLALAIQLALFFSTMHDIVDNFIRHFCLGRYATIKREEDGEGSSADAVHVSSREHDHFEAHPVT